MLATRHIAELKDPGIAAIASRMAGEIYGLDVVPIPTNVDVARSRAERAPRIFFLRASGRTAKRSARDRSAVIRVCPSAADRASSGQRRRR